MQRPPRHRRTLQAAFLLLLLALSCVCLYLRNSDERLTQELLGDWQVSADTAATARVRKVALLDGGAFANRSMEGKGSNLTERGSDLRLLRRCQFASLFKILDNLLAK